jgi:hypothetical protein
MWISFTDRNGSAYTVRESEIKGFCLTPPEGQHYQIVLFDNFRLIVSEEEFIRVRTELKSLQ